MSDYQCQHCGQTLSTDQPAGTTEPCPVCKQLNVVPESRRKLIIPAESGAAPEVISSNSADPPPPTPSARPYESADTLCDILWGVAVLCWILGVAFGIGIFQSSSPIVFGMACASQMLSGVLFAALAELLRCVRDIAINSHRIAEASEKREV